MNTSEPLVCDETIIDAVLGGKSYSLFAFDALETLCSVERRHKNDANQCADCETVMGFTDPAQPQACPACGGKHIIASQALLTDTAESLSRVHKLPPMSRGTAAALRVRILQVTYVKKNESTPPPESPTSSESIPAE